MAKPRPVALVTGGAARVGRAIVERLSQAGYDIGFTYHSSQREANQLVKRLNQAGGISSMRASRTAETAVSRAKSIAIQADLTNPENCHGVFDAMNRTFGRLDVLVNNASIFLPGNGMAKQMMAIHFESPLKLCQLFKKHLKRSHGHVVNMIDLLAFDPPPRYAAYAKSKAALAAATIGLARELAPEVTVNGIAPGVVEWPADYPPRDRVRYLRRVPLARAGTPFDVANLVHFLVSDGTYITGQIIRLDGGRSIT